jgi:release factor glutamine methyltransferase
VLYSELFSQTLHELTGLNPSGTRTSNPELEIQILMEEAFGITRDQFWISRQKPVVNKSRLRTFHRYAARLKNHEPLAYIIQKKPFYKTDFHVNRNVLIPRPETELLVEKALELISSPIRIMDIGAGSGNISISLALETGSTIVAIENDKKAIRVLRRNLKSHNVKDKVIIERSDLFTRRDLPFDMIVSNPPYVSEKEWIHLHPSVRDYEPRKALVSGQSGYEIIERIIKGAKRYLNPEGWLLMEIGYGQGERVEKLMRRAGFQPIQFLDDYNKIPRLACARA